MSRRFLFVVSSARRNGNAEQLARRAADGLPTRIEQEWLHLADFPLPPFLDQRHATAAPWEPELEGNARRLLRATLEASDIVMVAPVYWYSLPAAAKLYLDHWSGWLRAPGYDFKAKMAGKTLWGVSSFSDEDPALAAPLRETLRLTAAYMQMRWAGFLLGSGNRPGDVLGDPATVAAADAFFRPAF